MTITSTPALSAEAESILVQRAQAGDWDAAYALVSSQVRFLRAEAYARAGSHGKDDPEDLVSAGMEALLQAIHTFDPSRGVRFFTHAKFAIREAMADEVAANGSTIAIPGRTLRRYRKAIRETESLQAAREYAHDLEGMDPATFDAVHFALTGGRSLDDAGRDFSAGGNAQGVEGGTNPYAGVGASLDSETTVLLGSRGPAASLTETQVLARHLANHALACLTDERQRHVIGLTILSDDPMSDAQAAQALGLSKATVTRVRNAALQVMRDAIA